MAQLASSSQQFKTIAWLRWRIFVNGMRGKGAAGELVVRVLSYPLVALMVFGPAVGAGAGAYYFVNRGLDSYLAIPLWIIFALWQFIGVSTSTSGPSFDLSTLARFPMRYRDYLLIRLAFGLLDIPTLCGTACLIAMTVGISIADPKLLPWALPILFFYELANILFSRMVYAWFERWLAQRRTRELLTALILVFSLAIQFGSQFLQRINTTHHHHNSLSPLMLKASNAIVAVNWILPPGLTASSIEHAHSGLWAISSATLAGLMGYILAFLLILHIRLHAQYIGENLSEAPASTPLKSKAKSKHASSRITAESGLLHPTSVLAKPSAALLSPTVSACLKREIRYLLRSGPKLYALIMPVFMILLFSLRMAGIESFGFGRGSRAYLFTYGCAYAQLIMVSLLYNSLGSDGTGIQFYFIAPLRFRDVMLAKNILVGMVMLVELVLMYIVSAIVARPPSAALTVATLAWVLFTTLVNMSMGNVRSILTPKVVEASRVRRQNVSGVNSLISLLVVVGAVGLGSLVQFICTYLGVTNWAVAAIFAVLSAIALVIYISALRSLDRVAEDHRETLTRELCKA